MPAENVELVRRAYAAVNDGDMRGFLSLIDREVKWKAAGHGTDPETYAGHAGVNDYFATRLEVWEELRQEPEEFFDRGDVVVVAVRLRTRGRRSGVTLEQRGGHLWEVQRGRIMRFETFPDPETALAAAPAEDQTP